MGFNATQLAGVSMASQIGGAATSGIGGYFGAATQKANLSGQAAVADANARSSAALADANSRIGDTYLRIGDVNARILELGAQSELRQGQREVGKLTLQAGQLKSRQRVAMAANGIDLGSANAQDIRASTELMQEVDVDTIQANAMRSAWGYRNEAINAKTQAFNASSQIKMQALSDRAQSVNFSNSALASRAAGSAISPIGGVTTSLLGSAGNVASSWYKFQKEGAL